ncbi:anthranilate synthase family protein [Plantactinospora sp. B5E13]|uniref:anthranilate synthase family protein n=1 Tax=unclassified Plantactinospora TaxID=2631981 RepID=UPI00325CFBA7
MTWLHDVLDPDIPAFALLHRPDSDGDRVLLITGTTCTVPRLADLPVPVGRPEVAGPDVLALVPYRQIAERGFACVDDGTPLTALRVHRWRALDRDEVLAGLPRVTAPLRDVGFDLDDRRYADLVRRVVDDEIGTGEGANFVIKRSLSAEIVGYAEEPRRHALAVFGRLLAAETGAHWTFLVHTGGRSLVGASPERHVTVVDGVATMNPISGTFRYPPGPPDLAALRDFLDNGKEVDELYMVLDEELKMMGRLCRGGGEVIGPRIRPMARLAHTEYFIRGRTELDVRRVLHETLFAPTVTGSPLESACRVIARYEPGGRGYYAGALALIGREPTGQRVLDSAIGIRTADIDPTGRVRIDVGATLVRHSDPRSEAAETRAKAESLLAAFGDGSAPPVAPGWRDPGLWRDPDLERALAGRNERLARFWLQSPEARSQPVASLLGRRVLVIDCEDNFTAMLGHQLTALGLDVTIRRFDADHRPQEYDLTVVGPGPGDPRAAGHPKIAAMRRVIRQLLEQNRPLLAVCLGHQVLAQLLGLPVRRLPTPNQGAQRTVEVFGREEECGFYNTFAAYASADLLPAPVPGGVVEICRDRETGVVHATRGERFRSMQFHAESVLTRRGVELISRVSTELLAGTTRVPTAPPRADDPAPALLP